jgi:hypothetical protein
MKELEENSSATVQSASEHEAREAALQQQIEDLQRLMGDKDQALTVRISELEAKSRDLDDAREALVRVCAAACLLKNGCFARFALACQYRNSRRLHVVQCVDAGDWAWLRGLTGQSHEERSPFRVPEGHAPAGVCGCMFVHCDKGSSVCS